MQEFSYEIDYFVSGDGGKPFKEWLDRLRDVRGRAKIRIRLDRVRLGNFGDSRTVGEGVHELRIDYGPGYRLYFGQEGSRLILLLLGGDKSSQKKDIVRAKSFWRDYKGRKEYNESDILSKGSN
jgi:putative addiction module killer protein